MLERLAIIVTGRVQGVYFRAESARMANRLSLSGFAKNEADGSVSIEVEGSAASVDKFLKWCRIGPSLAEVQDVSATIISPTKGSGFEII